MQNKMTGFLWFLLCLIIERVKSLNDSETSIYWKPLKPLLFDEDVILKCYIKDCCPEGTQWTGGKTNSLLTLGRVSNNKAKYEETWSVDASYLKIKKFGIDDGDSLYTCFHGFSKYSKNLTINGNNFALMPTEESLKKNVTVRNGYLNANVEFPKVYPKPVCNCTFQKLGITDIMDIEHVNVSSDFYPTTSLFLNGKLNISHQICHEECLGTIQINCRIGIHAYKVFEAMVDIQLTWHQITKSTELTIICIVFPIVLTVFVVGLVFVRRTKIIEYCVRCATLINKPSSDIPPTDTRDITLEVTREESKSEDPSVCNKDGFAECSTLINNPSSGKHFADTGDINLADIDIHFADTGDTHFADTGDIHYSKREEPKFEDRLLC